MLGLLSVSSQAQLSDGSIAPDFTFTDMNGNSHNLYTYLDQGYTVYLDVFATWCPPCWSYHNAHHLKSLYESHGPSGMSGVLATTTDNVMVLSIDADGSTTDADMMGTGSNTAGDWLTGTPYPMINIPSGQANTFANNYNIAYYPTIYKICRDRVIEEVGQLTYPNIYSTEADCPQTAPTTSTDAKVNMVDEPFYSCGTVTADVTIQNYSLLPLTAALIEVVEGGSVIATQSWTGNLQPLAITTVPVTFTSANSSGFEYRVNATGDVNAANNSQTGGQLSQYLASNVQAAPFAADFNAALPAAANLTGPDADEMYGWITSANIGNVTSYVGPNSVNSGALTIDYINLDANANGGFIFGNFNTAGQDVTISMDYAKAAYSTATVEQDKLAIVHSGDCGSTWTEVWSKTGDDFNTAPAYSTGAFRPTSADHWAHASVTYAGVSDNDLVGIYAITQGGNYGWVENVNVWVTPAGVSSLEGQVELNLFPNPSNDVLNLEINNLEKQDFVVTITNMFGQVINTAELSSNSTNMIFDISTIAAGQYVLTITNDEGSKLSKPFMVK